MPIYTKKNGDLVEFNNRQDAARFEQEYPDATVDFTVGNDHYDVPIKYIERFQKEYPDADFWSTTRANQPEPKAIGAPEGEKPGLWDSVKDLFGVHSRKTPQQPVEQTAPLVKDSFEAVQDTTVPRRVPNIEQFAAEPKDLNDYVGDSLTNEQRRMYDINDKLRDAYLQREELAKKIEGEFKEKAGWNLLPEGLQNFMKKHSNSELGTAYRANEERIRMLENAKNKDDVGFWKGVEDAVNDPSVQSFGGSALVDALNKMKAAGATGNLPSSVALNVDQKLMLENEYKNRQTQQEYGDDTGFMYRAGQVSMQALPFVAEFLLTGGFGNIANTGAALGRLAGTKTSNAALRWLLRSTGTLAGDVAAATAMANTTGAAKTASDIIGRYLGNVAQDENGDYSFEGGKSLGRSIYEGEVANTLEYYTEMLGEHIPLGKMADKIGLSRLAKSFENITSSGWGKAVKDVLERAQIQSYPSEVLEEEANIVLNSLLVGDQKMSDLVDGRTQADIWGGMLFSIGFMNSLPVAAGGVQAGVNRARYYNQKHNVDRADEVAGLVFDDEKWQALREQIDNTPNEGFVDLFQSIMNDASLAGSEKQSAIEYMAELTKLRGYNMGEVAKAKDAVQNGVTPEQQANMQADTSYSAGYEASDEEKNNIKNQYEAALAELKVVFSYVDEMLDVIHNDPVGILSGNSDIGPEYRQALLDYINAKAAYDGMINRVQDDIDSMIAASNAQVDKQVNRTSGMVQPAVLKNGREVYVMDGNTVLKEDGSGIDTEYSSKEIIIQDKETGKLDFVPIGDITNIDQPINPDELKAQNADAIRQAQAQKQADLIDGKVAVGESYPAIGEDGTEVQLTINSDNGDGTVNVGVNGEASKEPMAIEAAQQMVDRYRLQQAQAANMERRAEQAMQDGNGLGDAALANNGLNGLGNAALANGRAYQLNEQVPVTLPDGTAGTAVITDIQEQASPERKDLFTVELYDEAGNGYRDNMVRQMTPDELNAMEVVPQTETPAPAEVAAAQPEAEQPTARSGETESPRQDEAQPEPMPMIGEGEDAMPDYGKVTPERAHQYLYKESGLDEADADEFLKGYKKEADDKLNKIKNKPPKPTDKGINGNINKFKAAKEAWQKQVDDAQRQVDYWNAVEQEQAMVVRQREQEAQEAAERERLMNMTDAERAMQNDLSRMEPRNLEELAAQMIGTGTVKLIRGTYGQQTGYGNDEAKKLFRIFAGADKGGVSIDKAGEVLEEAARGLNIRFDESDANAGRNAIIGVLQEVRTWGDLMNYIKNAREAEQARLAAEQERYEAQQRDEWAQENFKMDYEDYMAWENDYLPTVAEEYSSTPDEVYEEISNDLNNRDNERVTTETGSGAEAGGEVLPGSQSADEWRTGEAGQQGNSEGNDAALRGEDENVPATASRGYQLSDEIDENGRQFVLNSKGELAFGQIDADSGLTPAPILLSEGIITNPSTNDGYGLVHIEARHGSEIRNAGYKSVVDFIEEVAQNYTVIREGKSRDGVQTYILQLTDKHNNTLMVELSGDGTYWNINTAGIFKTSYGKNRKVVHNRPTSVKQPAETVEATQEAEQSDTQTSSSRNNTPAQPVDDKATSATTRVTPDSTSGSRAVTPDEAISEDKDTTSSANEQENGQENLQQQIDNARQEVDTNPTDAQKDAGNYKKGHIKLDGYDITIENPKGSTRSGKDASGKEWSVTMHNDYGYIRMTEGVDGDHIDVFLSDNPTEGNVYVIDQVDPKTGKFDEHKVMYGFANEEEARQAYLSNYSDGWQGLGTITGVTKEEFKKWVESSHRKTKPFAEYKSVARAKEIEQQEAGGAMVDQLENMGLDVSTDLEENRKALKKAKEDKSDAGKVRYFKTSDGKTYGFSYKGKIYLDLAKINAELPIHEYAHLWCEAFRRLNPKNWKKIVELTKADKETWDFVRQLNPELKDENDIAEEMIARFSGKRGAELAMAEFERMNGRDPNYKSKWANIWKNISKVIQDFWKQVGDFLNMEYESVEQLYDQVVKDFADKMNPRKRVEDWLKSRDNEYLQAVADNDMDKAKQLFDEALRENIGNGITPYIAVDSYRNKLDRLAHGVKNRDPEMVAKAAELMAPLIPKDAVLVPAPSHNGEATDMLDLAHAIGKLTGVPVANVLKGKPRGSQYKAKKSGQVIAAKDMGIRMEGELPEGRLPVIIDNVVDSGNTAEACVQAIGKGVVASLANAADKQRHVASLKSAEPVVTDRNGNVVPLSQRFEMGGSKYLGKPRMQKAQNATKPSKREIALRDALTDIMKRAGIEVSTDTEEGQRVLDADRESRAKTSRGKKRAPETVSVSQDEEHQQTVISSADGAKILNDLENYKSYLQNLPINPVKTFIGGLSKALRAKKHGSNSEYATFETKNGKIVTIRLADHNADISTFDNHKEDEGISIVITPKKIEGVKGNGKAHIVEFYYDAIKLRKADGKPLAEIVSSIRQALYSGEYKDTTGLAQREEVNADKVSFFRTPDGQAYGYTLNGKVYIDPRIATAETPLHEFAHLWAEALRKGNAKEWQNVVDLMKGTPIWEEVKQNYPELTNDDDIAEEVLAHYSGRRGAERLRQAQAEAMEKAGSDVFAQAEAISAFDSVKRAIKRFWKVFADFLHIHYESAEEVADRVMADLLDGVNPNRELEKLQGDPHKAAQLDIVTGSNAMTDDYHVGIRSVDDIKTYQEAVEEGEGIDSYPDFTAEDAQRALDEGEVTVYSSKPIENGVFVSTSRMEAQDYAGDGKVYSKRVPLADVAWIYANEGQYAKVDGKVRPQKVNEAAVSIDDLSDMSDEQLLNNIDLGGPSEEDAFAIEYDERHRKEFDAYYDQTAESLQNERPSLEDASARLNDLIRQWKRGAYASSMRTPIKAQMYAFDDYVAKLTEEEVDSRTPEEFTPGVQPKQEGSETTTYVTTKGKKAEYRQLSLDFDAPVEANAKPEQKQQAKQKPKQEEKPMGVDLTQVRLRELGEGEVCYVERRFTEDKSFVLTGGKNKIKTAADVAYIFRCLQDKAIEHAFMVFVKKGDPTIVHVGMGMVDQTAVDASVLSTLAEELQPDEIYFVHNHPSGRLIPSQADKSLVRSLRDRVNPDIPITNMIIDTYLHQYNLFEATGSSVGEGEVRVGNGNNRRLPLFAFDERLFHEDFLPKFIEDSRDVFITASLLRLGDNKKIGCLVMDKAGIVMGNLYLPVSNIRDISEDMVRNLIKEITLMNGTQVALHGTTKFITQELNDLIRKFKHLAPDVRVTDVIQMDGENGDFPKYYSAVDQGAMEPASIYGVKEPGGEITYNVVRDSGHEPTKTGKGYKVFVLKDGKLYPPMVANPNGAETPVGVWLEAQAAPISGESKTGRPQVKAGGKGTQGGSGTLAYRPGWHLGEIPYAKQFNRKDEAGEKNLFPKNFVWAEVEYANDVDYQDEAREEGTNANGKYQHSLAGLKRVPVNGSYRYRTNPDPTTDEWIITGAMKVNRILTPSEVDEMVRAAGREPQQRQDGAVTDEQVKQLNELLFNNDRKNIELQSVIPDLVDGVTTQEVESAMGTDLVKGWMKEAAGENRKWGIGVFKLFNSGWDMIREFARARLGIDNKYHLSNGIFYHAAEELDRIMDYASEHGLDKAIANKYDFKDRDTIERLMQSDEPIYSQEEVDEILKHVPLKGVREALIGSMNAFKEEPRIQEEIERLTKYDGGNALTKAFVLYSIARKRLVEHYANDNRFFRNEKIFVRPDGTHYLPANKNSQPKDGDKVEIRRMIKPAVNKELLRRIAITPISSKVPLLPSANEDPLTKRDDEDLFAFAERVAAADALRRAREAERKAAANRPLTNDEAAAAVSDFQQEHKGAIENIVYDGKGNFNQQLAEAGITGKDADVYEERLKGGRISAFYSPKYNRIIILAPNVARKELNSYLWHENFHHAFDALYGESKAALIDAAYEKLVSIGGWTDGIIDMVRKRYGDRGEAVVKEEAMTFFIQMLYDSTKNGTDIELAKALDNFINDKAKDGGMDFLKETFDYIINGIEYDGRRMEERGREDAQAARGSESVVLRNPGRVRTIKGTGEDKFAISPASGGSVSTSSTSAPIFQNPNITMRDKATARDEYEKMISSGLYQFREAVQDSMRGLYVLYKSVLGKDFTKIEDVPGFENAYLGENRMSSQSAAEQHDYFNRFMKPLLETIGKLTGGDKAKRDELTRYMMAKHGLERNVVLAERDARIAEEGGGDYADALAKNRERDYSGLTALTKESDVTAAEAKAMQIVDDFENNHDKALLDELWDRTREVSHATLEKLYRSGLMSYDTYQKTLAMFQNYIPLRGWDETTSDEVYGYLTANDSPLLGSVLKKAGGRTSMADDPIAYIAQMADKAIMEGNRNRMKQTFLNFVLNHPSDLVSVSDLWLQHDDVNDAWVAVFPELEPTDTAEEVAQKLADFENRMSQLATADPEHFARGREKPNIPYKVVKGNMREHQVLVKRNGKVVVLTINGNPRAAQALNGLTNPDVNVNGVVGNLLRAGEYVNRNLSAFYTTRNPDFVVSNFLRDMVYSNVMTWVKENPRYAMRFHRNVGKLNPVTMRKLLGKWENGTLDDNNYTENMFRQFMMNGGETGYTSVRDLEAHKRNIADELKMQGSTGRKAWKALGMQLDLMNRAVENCARFAAFVTSREMGRSMERSIYDAKEVSVNFNKKGSGGKMVNTVGMTWLGKAGSYLSGLGRVMYVFWNPGVQGVTNFGRAGKRNTAKAIAGGAAVYLLGQVMPLLAQLLSDGDDDDKNAYYNLPEYIRRNSICFFAGDQWVTIPLPIELRGIYGMGELATGVITGNERYSDQELAFQIASQLSQVLPLDMLEGGGGITPFIPSSVKPLVEAYVLNRRWTGLPVYKDTPYNKSDPEWTKAYKSADQTLVEISKFINEATGGDDFKKGAIDINPAKVEYLLSGVLGGYENTVEKLKKMAETAAGQRDFEWRNMLLANRVVTSGDESTEFRKLQNEFYRYKDEADETKRLLRKYENAENEGVLGMAEKVDFLMNSDEYRRYEIYEEYKDDIDAYREMIQDSNDRDEKKELEREMYGVIKEMLARMKEK